jgi:hypothetical protein
MKDSRATLSLAPTAAWLLIANPVGIAQAAWNHDPFWNTGPLVEPNDSWVKKNFQLIAGFTQPHSLL